MAPSPPLISYLGVPIIVAEKTIGVLAISSYSEVRTYDPSDQRLLTTLATTLGVAIENARQFEQTQRRAEREALVNVINQKIQNAATVENAMQTAVSELAKALNIRKAVVDLKTNPHHVSKQETK